LAGVATTVLTANFDFSQPKSAIKQTQAQIDQLKNKAKGAQGGLDSRVLVLLLPSLATRQKVQSLGLLHWALR
jgi:hypothetical protein